MRSKRVLLVDWQLEELANSVEGASVLFDCLRTSQLATEEQAVAADRGALSILNLTVAHMRQLIRALRFQSDASDIMTSANTVPSSRELKEDHAVILVPGPKSQRQKPKDSRPTSVKRARS